ncbi:hypothetical protein OOT46_23315 [Aquabacterium sp. A7-Y]|uniref:hypothetical protein n=1 Tax=Aquabacterium sp. A7-Y TaxID=1349605 RepID=UPI00223C90DD|nr:hypothetical protein [Aquabacterium sp. A7-Y]MCW7540753.1 hypothetical protein [Aquabacterium sp. A7-Y]
MTPATSLFHARRPGLSRRIALLLLACGLATSACAEADPPAGPASAPAPAVLQGPKHCQFVVPQGWSGYTVRWEGACAKGRASGSGVLRALEKQQVKEVFYGRLAEGAPQIGVIEKPEGLVAGEFKQGAAVPTDDPGVTVKAFREAEAAALQAASRFKASGNEASGRFYREKAEMLRSQMD